MVCHLVACLPLPRDGHVICFQFEAIVGEYLYMYLCEDMFSFLLSRCQEQD